jgi:hypothetical protein
LYGEIGIQWYEIHNTINKDNYGDFKSRSLTGPEIQAGLLFCPSNLLGWTFEFGYKYFKESSNEEGLDPFSVSSFHAGLAVRLGKY